MFEDIVIIDNPISRSDLKKIAAGRFGDMVKGVVDVDKRIIALGGEMHSDEEALLLERGSVQSSLWGINLYVELDVSDFLEFDSMINIRPSQNNRTRGVEDEKNRELIRKIVMELVR